MQNVQAVLRAAVSSAGSPGNLQLHPQLVSRQGRNNWELWQDMWAGSLPGAGQGFEATT